MKNFSIKEALLYGWDATKNNFYFLFTIFLFLFIFILISSLIVALTEEKNILIGYLLQVIFIATSFLLEMGFIKIFLKIYDNEKPELKDLFLQYPLFFRFVAASILSQIIVFLGLLLLIIPGIILGIALSFFPYLIVDKKIPSINSLKQSYEITKGVRFKLFIFYIILGLINLLGVLFLVVGLFVTLPLTSLAIVFVYRKLLEQEENKNNLSIQTS